MFIKIQSCINLTTTKKEKKFRSTAEKVSNGFLHFISQFNVSIQRKKFSFYRSTTKNFFFISTLDVSDDDNDVDEEVRKVSSCFFLFPYGVLFKKSSLESFLSCCCCCCCAAKRNHR